MTDSVMKEKESNLYQFMISNDIQSTANTKNSSLTSQQQKILNMIKSIDKFKAIN